ncbi:MAG: FAD-binding oxidoreductase [Pyrinomonadaceae bacterium]|nr:FAD-binding oxidoreductase [Pyrinomonadaceae bacterium]
MTYDIAIIGAGIVGAACAMRLAKEGFKVAVIEANEIASGSTAAGMGHIVVMDDSEAQFSLTNFSQKLWNEISAQLPLDCEYENCGTIWVAANGEEMQEARRKKHFYGSRGVEAEILDEKSLREAEPNLREGLAGGLLVPNDSVVYQLCATRYFLETTLSNNVRLIENTCVTGITGAGVKFANGDLLKAEKVIIAGGFWSRELIQDLKIVRRKGHLVITERYPNFVKHQLVELGYLKSAHSSETESVAFNIQPRMTEQLLIGSSRQFGNQNKEIDYKILKQMMERAFEFIPKLRELSALRIWTGFRPATPDNLPYIGAHPRIKNTYVAAGHEGLGITTSLGSAEILTDEILGRKSEIDRKPYSPARFSSVNKVGSNL